MLRLMRKQAGSWIIKILLGAIVIVFIFWGVGSFTAERTGRVAMVNGDQITQDEYRNAYDNMVEQMRRRFGNNFSETMIEQFKIKTKALDQLINNRLLVQEADRLDFRVSNVEVADVIRNIGAFKSGGVFSNRLYKNVLNRLRLSPEEFELEQKEAMLIEKLRNVITSSAKVSDQEVLDWYNWNDATVNIDYVLFNPDRYKKIELSQKEIKAYFEENKDNYKMEPMVKVRYLYFDPKAYQSKINISDDEIQDYYDENQKEFETPKTVQARHILFKLDKDAPGEQVEKIRNKALKIMKMARKGKDFAQLAKKYSEGPSKDKGGFLGTFKKETMVKPFADKAFSMEAGEISDPVRTRFGWHIIKVEKTNEASVLSLEQAKKKIKEKLIEEKSKILAYDDAESVLDVSFDGDAFLKAAKEHHVKVVATDFFTEKRPPGKIKESAKFASIAFGLSTGDISDIVESVDGYYIMQLLEKIPSMVPKFEKVKGKVYADLLEQKKSENAKKDARNILAALHKGRSMKDESKSFNLKPKSTGFFKRNASIPTIGYDNKISKAAFQLSDKNKLPEKAIKGSKGYYVIQFKERKAPEPENLAKEKDSIKQRLLEQKKSTLFDAMLAKIKSKSEIEIKKEYIE